MTPRSGRPMSSCFLPVMRDHLASIAALALVVAIPFLLKPKDTLISGPGETLVIVTPHNEAIRYEFARAFRDHERTKGRSVRVDWRTPGGTSEISRYLASQYSASFENYWRSRLERPWTARVA